MASWTLISIRRAPTKHVLNITINSKRQKDLIELAFVAKIKVKSILSEDGVTKIGRLSRVILRLQTGMIPEGSRVWPVGRWPWLTSKPTGVQGFAQKPKTEYSSGEESKRKQAHPFSRNVWGLLIVIFLAKELNLIEAEKRDCATWPKRKENIWTTQVWVGSIEKLRLEPNIYTIMILQD